MQDRRRNRGKGEKGEEEEEGAGGDEAVRWALAIAIIV